MYRYIVFIFIIIAFAACKKTNNASKIPQISYLGMEPDSIKAGSAIDTVFIYFSFADGDADIGNDPNGSQYDIYVKDSRFDSAGFTGYFFPGIDQSIEDPTKGLSGTAIFKQLGAFIIPRTDSVHTNFGDTLYYEMYIKDRAGHESNHFTTAKLHIRP